jgi:hypothetical protein
LKIIENLGYKHKVKITENLGCYPKNKRLSKILVKTVVLIFKTWVSFLSITRPLVLILTLLSALQGCFVFLLDVLFFTSLNAKSAKSDNVKNKQKGGKNIEAVTMLDNIRT